ncbi:DUF6308 family protein [Pseudarthrobacter sp. 1C304]|uniref:DUF6308 family protein n=1 Tax=Pseudarthrobacter sp. 1C304 TaxID=3457438 RepID=UPI003FD458D2
MSEIIRVGGASAGFDEAFAWASRYITNQDQTYSYPAYDAYPGACSDTVGPQDLLAPALLNAGHNPVRSYYTLEGLLDEINEKLSHPAMTGTLTDASDETIGAIASLFGILDEVSTPGVKLTKLSKVLHRKRPDLIPLYDPHIWRCYVGSGPESPLPRDKARSWEQFSLLWLPAVQKDLRDQADTWERIAGLATKPPITSLRALDMVGWWLGRPKRRKNR